jgi:hypothetical protein
MTVPSAKGNLLDAAEVDAHLYLFSAGVRGYVFRVNAATKVFLR